MGCKIIKKRLTSERKQKKRKQVTGRFRYREQVRRLISKTVSTLKVNDDEWRMNVVQPVAKSRCGLRGGALASASRPPPWQVSYWNVTPITVVLLFGERRTRNNTVNTAEPAPHQQTKDYGPLSTSCVTRGI